MVRTLALAILPLMLAVSATAQIYEWTDESGSRHFTNDIEDIPLEQRTEARVVVRQRRAQVAAQDNVAPRADSEPASVDGRVADPSAPQEAPVVAKSEVRETTAALGSPRRQAQVVYDRSRERVVTHSEPIIVAAPAPVVQDVFVNIDGPLSVSQVVVPTSPYGGFDPRYHHPGYYDPASYGPPVSTSFDRGRFRHRTLRMVLQDQFQYDRNDAFLYVENRIPRGPVFQSHLPRGLSVGRTRSSAKPTMARLHRIASPKKR